MRVNDRKSPVARSGIYLCQNSFSFFSRSPLHDDYNFEIARETCPLPGSRESSVVPRRQPRPFISHYYSSLGNKDAFVVQRFPPRRTCAIFFKNFPDTGNFPNREITTGETWRRRSLESSEPSGLWTVRGPRQREFQVRLSTTGRPARLSI